MHTVKFLPFVSLFLSGFQTISQNLVTNGSFETYTSLPLNYGDFCVVNGWINPSGCCVLNPNFGTPDYVNTAAAWPVGCPNNGFGTINPRTGSGIVGFTSYANYGTPPVFREYLTKRLNAHLNIGQSYTVTFFIARAANPFFKYATNNIGVYFSVSQPVQSGTAVISVIPQWEYTSVFSSSTWTQMTFNLVPTDTFNFITIGNFRSDALTAKSTINSGASGLYSHYFVDDVSVISNSPLPVELLSFAVRQEGPRVRAEWSTLSEQNSDYFMLEKSDDLEIFNDVKKVESHHNTNYRSDYATYDEQPDQGVSYYRLRQTDYDGKNSYSRVHSLYVKIDTPQPQSWYDKNVNSIQLIIPPEMYENGAVSLYDFGGREVFSGRIQQSGRMNIDVGFLSKGIYSLVLTGNETVFKKKLVIF